MGTLGGRCARACPLWAFAGLAGLTALADGCVRDHASSWDGAGGAAGSGGGQGGQGATNAAPEADAQQLTTQHAAPIDVVLTASDAEGDTLSFNIVTPPTNGTLDGTAPTLTYTPQAGFEGVDSFAFTASDESTTSVAATVTIKIWWDEAWLYRHRLTFDNSAQDEALTGFPVLVALDETRVSYADIQDAGQDLRFIDAASNRVLDHEIERWDETGTSTVWVNVPEIAAMSASDYIWLYHGHSSIPDGQSSADVWDTDYRAVWHLSDDPGAAQMTDSTAHGNHATPMGTMTSADLIAGQLAGGIDLDGVDDFLEVCVGNCPTSLAITTNSYTLEAWARTPTGGLDEDKGLIDKRILGNDERYMIGIVPIVGAQEQINCRVNTDLGYARIDQPGVPQGSWSYLVCRYDGSLASGNLQSWVNGVHLVAGDLDHTGNLLHTATDDVILGKRADDARFYEGDVDELRISSVARSDSYVRAQYESMSDAFIVYGSVERIDDVAPR